MIAPGKLGQRTTSVKIYGYADAGTDGVVDSRYTLRATRWASFTPDQATERSVGEAAQHERRATFGFYDRVTITDHDVLVVNGEAYQVSGIPDPRTSVPGMLREVQAFWVDKATLTLLES